MKIMMNKQNGLTLVEMMIAMTLSVILLAGLAQIFNSNKLSFQMTNGIARVQESGRISMEFLGREIRSAGFVGCATGAFGTNFVNNVKVSSYSDAVLKEALALYDGNNAISGFNDITTIASGSTLDDFGLSMGSATGNVVSGTDALLFLGTKPCLGGNVVAHSQASSELTIADAAACGLVANDIVVVSNCNTADAFALSATPTAGNVLEHKSTKNTTDKLSTTYDDKSFVYKMSSTLFYVGVGASGEPALFMKSLGSAASATPYQVMELAEGVENFQVLFGEDTSNNSSVDRYVTSDLVSDMNDVKSLKTRLLVRSADRSSSDIEQSISFEGATIVSADNRYRKPYESTFTIRNRVR
jgi:type IV pilus assembly protein PilW